MLAHWLGHAVAFVLIVLLIAALRNAPPLPVTEEKPTYVAPQAPALPNAQAVADWAKLNRASRVELYRDGMLCRADFDTAPGPDPYGRDLPGPTATDEASPDDEPNSVKSALDHFLNKRRSVQ